MISTLPPSILTQPSCQNSDVDTSSTGGQNFLLEKIHYSDEWREQLEYYKYIDGGYYMWEDGEESSCV
jgi:hypothetical protein